MTHDETFKAALSMFQVTPDNYNRLYAEMILHVAGVIVDADKKYCAPPEHEKTTEEA